MKVLRWLSAVLLVLALPVASLATSVSVPNTYTNGQVIDATAMNANFSAIVSWANGNVDHINIGSGGIYASQIIPTSTGQATFGGAWGYTFNPGVAGQVPLTIDGATSQSADIFDVFLTPAGTLAASITSAGNLKINALTASQCVGTDSSKQLVSNTNCISATPTPLPSPNFTAGNANVTVTNNFPTSVTISATTPAPLSTIMHGQMVLTLPTAQASVGATTMPVFVPPNQNNLAFTGSHAQCDVAGSTGSAMAWVFVKNTSVDQSTAWTTAAPIPTSSFATNAVRAGGSTVAPTLMPTDTTAVHATWYAAQITVAPTTACTGKVSFTLEYNWTP